jgi:hypothetical protein
MAGRRSSPPTDDDEEEEEEEEDAAEEEEEMLLEEGFGDFDLVKMRLFNEEGACFWAFGWRCALGVVRWCVCVGLGL